MDPTLLKYLGMCIALGGLLLGAAIMVYANARIGGKSLVIPDRFAPPLAGLLSFAQAVARWRRSTAAQQALEQAVGNLGLLMVTLLVGLLSVAVTLLRTDGAEMMRSLPGWGPALASGLLRIAQPGVFAAIACRIIVRRTAQSASPLEGRDLHDAVMVPAALAGVGIVAVSMAAKSIIVPTPLVTVAAHGKLLESILFQIAAFAILLVIANKAKGRSHALSLIFQALVAWYVARWMVYFTVRFTTPYLGSANLGKAAAKHAPWVIWCGIYIGACGLAWLRSEQAPSSGNGITPPSS